MIHLGLCGKIIISIGYDMEETHTLHSWPLGSRCVYKEYLTENKETYILLGL